MDAALLLSPGPPPLSSPSPPLPLLPLLSPKRGQVKYLLQKVLCTYFVEDNKSLHWVQPTVYFSSYLTSAVTFKASESHYLSDVAVSSFHDLQSSNNGLPKRLVGSHRNIYLHSHTVVNCSVLVITLQKWRMIKPQQTVNRSEKQLAHLTHDMNAHGLHTYLNKCKAHK